MPQTKPKPPSKKHPTSPQQTSRFKQQRGEKGGKRRKKVHPEHLHTFFIIQSVPVSVTFLYDQSSRNVCTSTNI